MFDGHKYYYNNSDNNYLDKLNCPHYLQLAFLNIHSIDLMLFVNCCYLIDFAVTLRFELYYNKSFVGFVDLYLFVISRILHECLFKS